MLKEERKVGLKVCEREKFLGGLQVGEPIVA